MDAVYALANPFVGHPGRAGFVALICLIGGAVILASRGWPKLQAWLLITAGFAWAIFALLEGEATRERSNIRVDLLFTWPVLCAINVACAVTWIVLAYRHLANRSD